MTEAKAFLKTCEDICIVGGYQLDLYCAECRADGSYAGSRKGEATRRAKEDGWQINFKARTALCRVCKRQSK